MVSDADHIMEGFAGQRRIQLSPYVERLPVTTLSIQLYTVRDLLAENTPETLKFLADTGFTRVEPFAFTDTKEALAEALPTFGLTAPTAHHGLLGVDLVEVCEAAQLLGVTTIFDPMIDPERWNTRDSVETVAAELKHAATVAADYGLRVGYHNHAFELRSRIDGVSALEIFAEAAGTHVDLEVDTYWAEVGGEDAASLLRRLGEQVTALHIKDGPKTDVNTDQVALGAGDMPIPEILAAAPQAQLVAELDDFAGDIRDAVKDSFTYMTDNGLLGARS